MFPARSVGATPRKGWHRKPQAIVQAVFLAVSLTVTLAAASLIPLRPPARTGAAAVESGIAATPTLRMH